MWDRLAVLKVLGRVFNLRRSREWRREGGDEVVLGFRNLRIDSNLMKLGRMIYRHVYYIRVVFRNDGMKV